MRSGSLRLDLEKHEVFVGGKEIFLSPKQFEVLRILKGSGGRVMSRFELMRLMYGRSLSDSSRAIDQYVSKLRRKGVRQIETITAYGYKWRQP